MAFPRFPELAYELRELIWLFALPRPAPEVCITRAENLPTPENSGRATVPLKVYTPFPVIMHVCHEARQLALRNWEVGNLELVNHPGARCEVPVRRFDPSLDTLYWPAPRHMGFSDYLGGYNGINPAMDTATAKQLRHLAVEWGMMNAFPLRFVEYILESCPALETISVVFAHVPDKTSWMDRFPPPDGRCRLRSIGEEEARATTVTLQDPGEMDWYASLIPNPRGPYASSLEDFLKSLRESLDAFGTNAFSRMMNRYNGTAWNDETKRFDGLVLIPKMFAEYQDGRWVPESYEERTEKLRTEQKKATATKEQETKKKGRNWLSSSLEKSMRAES